MDILQSVLEQHSEEVLLNGLPYVHAFRAFSAVVDTCFGVALKDGYKENIQEFKRLYLSLGISVTPKVGSSGVILKYFLLVPSVSQKYLCI